MDDPLKRLETRVAALEKTVEELKKAAGLPEKQETEKPRGDEGFLLAEVEKRGGRAHVPDLRRAVPWDNRRFDQALTSLASKGCVALHDCAGAMLSIRRMGECYMGDDGQIYSEVSVA
jgi:hypothetical protein